MIIPRDRNKERKRRHKSIRKKVIGTSERPRLCVFRSLKNIYAQIIDDHKGITLVSASSMEKEIEEKKDAVEEEVEEKKDGKSKKGKKKKEALKGKRKIADLVGGLIAKRALEKDIKTVVFDRAGYKYHGRVESLANGARKEGLIF